MTNGEKFKEIFGVSQVDEGDFYAYVWLPNHTAIEFSTDWWNAPYKTESEDAISREYLVEHIKACIQPKYNAEEAIRMVLRMLRKDLRKLPPVTSRSLNPEADREESKAYCAECDHIEMCSWYPHDGCEWLKTDRYNAGYNAAKREIALSGEYERAYERGKADAHPDINDGKLSEIPTGSESEDKE